MGRAERRQAAADSLGKGLTINNGGCVVVGLSCDYHDAAAAVLVDGVVVAAAEQERFSRQKHDSSLPVEALVSCLSIAGLSAHDVDHVVYYEKPLPLVSRFLSSKQRQGPRSAKSFIGGASELTGRNLLIGPRVAKMFKRLGVRHAPRLQFVEHHRSHAAAAFLASPFDHAAILTIDGVGEWATATIGVGSHHRLELLEEQRFPNSIGLVYSFITAYCGFEPNSDEYKLMGLAPYGTPTFSDGLAEIVEMHDDGSVRVDARAVGWFSQGARKTTRLSRLLGGPPRAPGEALTQREADLAASIQLLTESAVLGMATRAQELTGESAVCLAGGVALNCVANGRLAREGPFERIWIQPASGDAGSAIGAALSFWHEALGNERSIDGATDGMSGALLGPALPPVAEIAGELDASEIEHVVLDDDALAGVVAARLAAGDVVGWCQGRMEFGPRALGNRSILADPRSTTVRERLNLKVKGRESFRPFAPAVLADRVTEWFELTGDSPYMLIVAPLRKDRMVEQDQAGLTIAERSGLAVSDLPACTHVDGSARVQTVSPERNPGFDRLLREFDRQTGCPVLLNTSFNRAGEPIVGTVQEAVDAARRGGLDLLVLGSVVVEGSALNRTPVRVDVNS